MSTPATPPPEGAGALLEREGELARIAVALAAAREGRGGLVLVEGPAGIGKTRLLIAARDAARDAGFRVLSARGSELELDFGHGVTRQLLEPSLLGAPDELRRELTAGAAGHAAPLFGLDDSGRPAALGVDPGFALLHGLYWLCANLAQREPLLLAVDDAHWADAPSLRFLAFLARRIDDLPVVLVCASRPAEPTMQSALFAELAADPQADLLQPGPLTAAGVASLVRNGLEAEPDEDFVAACLTATGGIPFLVRELLLALRADAITPSQEAAARVGELGPKAIARSILLRLGRLGPAAGALARALAVLGADAELRHVAALAGLDFEQAGEAADVLAAAGIVDAARPLRFVHPIVRTAIHADLPPSERETRHARAARLFAAEGASLDRVAAHLLAAAPAGDRWTVEQLQAAAELAVSQGAPDSAAHYLARALEEPPAPELRTRVLIDLGTAETHCGSSDGVARLEEAFASAQDDETVLEAGLMLGRALALAERPRQAIETFQRLLARIDPAHEQRLMLEAAIVAQAQIHAVPAALVAPRRAHLAQAAAAGDVPRSALAVLAVDGIFRGADAAEAAELARRSLAGTPRPHPEQGDPHLFFHALMALLWAERYDEAGPYYDAALEDAHRAGSAPRAAAAACGRSLLAFRRGAIADAEADARMAMDAVGGGSRGFYGPFAVAVLVAALLERAAYEEAEACIASCEDVGEERSSYGVTLLLLGRARFNRARGRPEQALADARAAGARLRRMDVRNPTVAGWRSEAALALLALGRGAEAAELCAEEVALAAAAGTPRAAAVAMLTAGLVAGGGPDDLRPAVEALERTPAALDLARARSAYGAALRRAGQRAEARDELRQALDLAYQCSAGALAAATREELVAAGARPRTAALTGWDALTPSERRVAQMAAGGLTNREIAQALFVTPRTVEGHLTNVYGKLRVSSREELTGLVPETAGVTAAPAG